ncbi:MAG: protein kinase [Sphaerospermopsis sp. SIO1G2]|nr:protein kinase [Sphaerospermopsis sp. SIO1G2]
MIEVLGSGGFGETSLAEDIHLPSRKRFVIKELKPINNDTQTSILVQQRFEREAAILENLGENSDQIPTLYAYFPENGKFYLVQEWIQGQTLSNIIESQGKLDETTVKEILLSLLSVLDYVHSKGIIHRDIKPDNIIIRSKDNKPVLIDFGAVKETIRTVVNPANQTQSIVIGTPGYMPSEQAIGRPVYATDIYSLGLTAIYLLTGIPPQELETDPQTGKILWQEQTAGISPEMVEVLTKAIEPRPSDRYSTASKMLNALKYTHNVSHNHHVPAHNPTTAATISINSPQAYSNPQNPVIREIPNPNKQNKQVVIIASVIVSSLIGAIAIANLIRSPQTSSTVTNNSTNNSETHNSAVLPNESSATEAVSPTPGNTPNLTSQTNSSPSSTPPVNNPIITNTPTPVFTFTPETQPPQPQTNSNPAEFLNQEKQPDQKDKKKDKKKGKKAQKENNEVLDNFNSSNNNNNVNVPAFPTGVSRNRIEATLGKPRIDRRGFWPNTRAVLYEVVPDQIDLGYIFDRNNGRLRQTEVGFAGDVDPQLMQSTLKGLLAGQITAQIQRGLQQVQQRQIDDFAFRQGGVKGQIIRQNCDSIYISIWESDLHDFVNPDSARKC